MASSLIEVDLGEGVSKPLTIITKTHSSQEEFAVNIETNMKRDVIRFHELPGLLLARREPIAIVGGGPSLNAYKDKIGAFKHVMVCGSAHDHLVGMGITPTFAIAVDTKEDAVDYYQNPQEVTSYLLASQCHPNMFDRLKDHKIAMWHFKGQCDKEELFRGEPQINWGCMIGVLSIQMALMLGFQHLHFFGFDCSYIENDHHAYDVGRYHQEVDEKKFIATVAGRQFLSTMALISQAEHLFDVFASSDGAFIKGWVYGDGLWANVIKASPPEMSRWLEAPDVA